MGDCGGGSVNGEWEEEFSEDRLADTGLGLHACEAPDADVDSEVEGARSDRGSGSRPTVTHISAVLIFGCAGAGGSDDEDCMIRGRLAGGSLSAALSDGLR